MGEMELQKNTFLIFPRANNQWICLLDNNNVGGRIQVIGYTKLLVLKLSFITAS